MSTNIYDYAYTSVERLAFAGRLYRVGTGYTSLTASGQYASICFETPANELTLYRFSKVDKSGNEIGVALIEDCTYSGGTPITPWNVNRNYRSIPSSLIDVRTGVSSSLVITGGSSAPLVMVPGSNNPSSKPGGGSESSGYIPLRPGTKYALKLTALSGEATLTAVADIATLRREQARNVIDPILDMMLVHQDNTNGGGWFSNTITTSGTSPIYRIPVMPVRDVGVSISGMGYISFTTSAPLAIAGGTALFEQWDGLSQINPAVTAFMVTSISGLVTANILVKTAYAS